ncbi:hypothetical protein THOM_0336 [Trachipleistophora hominis]|uniref:Uncharacterized protein n=1 Tax=Trachipleistophora hominis TaxID=72359 RepID=L7JZ68_TRAHO|nr:hypothetical protein THOM_0336 [Trachipleistophora hominis]
MIYECILNETLIDRKNDITKQKNNEHPQIQKLLALILIHTKYEQKEI